MPSPLEWFLMSPCSKMPCRMTNQRYACILIINYIVIITSLGKLDSQGWLCGCLIQSLPQDSKQPRRSIIVHDTHAGPIKGRCECQPGGQLQHEQPGDGAHLEGRGPSESQQHPRPDDFHHLHQEWDWRVGHLWHHQHCGNG